MANNKKKTYWPHLILGFLIVGLTLGYWTIKSASSMPVQEVNQYMLKYQMADLNINEIMHKKAAFDNAYMISIEDKEMIVMSDNIHSRLPQPNAVNLTKGVNSFSYVVSKKDGSVVPDAKVTFLLTQPHSQKEDQLIENIPFSNGVYEIKDVKIEKPGRYVLQFKAQINENTIGYADTAAYLAP